LINEDGEVLGELPEPSQPRPDTYVNNTDRDIMVSVLIPKQSRIKVGKRPRPIDKSGREFAFVHLKELQAVLPELTANERAAILTLAAYIGYDNTLRVEGKNGQPIRMTISDAEKLMPWTSRTTVTDVLNGLERKGLLLRHKGRPKYIDLNPLYFRRGRSDYRAKEIEQFQKLWDVTVGALRQCEA
jgi:hypothetical protein